MDFILLIGGFHWSIGPLCKWNKDAVQFVCLAPAVRRNGFWYNETKSNCIQEHIIQAWEFECRFFKGSPISSSTCKAFQDNLRDPNGISQAALRNTIELKILSLCGAVITPSPVTITGPYHYGPLCLWIVVSCCLTTTDPFLWPLRLLSSCGVAIIRPLLWPLRTFPITDRCVLGSLFRAVWPLRILSSCRVAIIRPLVWPLRTFPLRTVVSLDHCFVLSDHYGPFPVTINGSSPLLLWCGHYTSSPVTITDPFLWPLRLLSSCGVAITPCSVTMRRTLTTTLTLFLWIVVSCCLTMTVPFLWPLRILSSCGVAIIRPLLWPLTDLSLTDRCVFGSLFRVVWPLRTLSCDHYGSFPLVVWPLHPVLWPWDEPLPLLWHCFFGSSFLAAWPLRTLSCDH